jgi:hypothetical protein
MERESRKLREEAGSLELTGKSAVRRLERV